MARSILALCGMGCSERGIHDPGTDYRACPACGLQEMRNQRADSVCPMLEERSGVCPDHGDMDVLPEWCRNGCQHDHDHPVFAAGVILQSKYLDGMRDGFQNCYGDGADLCFSGAAVSAKRKRKICQVIPETAGVFPVSVHRSNAGRVHFCGSMEQCGSEYGVFVFSVLIFQRLFREAFFGECVALTDADRKADRLKRQRVWRRKA